MWCMLPLTRVDNVDDIAHTSISCAHIFAHCSWAYHGIGHLIYRNVMDTAGYLTRRRWFRFDLRV